MDLKYLTTFKTIVTCGSFTKAAKELNYTQSTITFQMQQLEQEISVPLFEKVGRRMLLTKAGEQFLPHVEQVLAAVEQLNSVHGELEEMRDTLNIGVGETLLCYKMPEILKKFHKLAPKAKLQLRSMNCYEIRDALLAGELDLGIFYKDIGVTELGLQVEDMGTYPLKLVASPQTAKSFPDFVTQEQRLQVPMIINEPNCIFRQMFETYLREQSITLNQTIELWSIATIKNLVISDLGISYLPAFAVEEELETGLLCEIETLLEEKTITAVCGWKKNKWLSPLMRLFIELNTEKTVQELAI